jgi:anti-sigma factor RsiW
VSEPFDPPAHLPCNEAVELLTDYLEGALDDVTTRRVEAHLDLCPPCQVYLDQLRETAAAVRRLTPPPVPDGLAARLAATFAEFPR